MINVSGEVVTLMIQGRWEEIMVIWESGELVAGSDRPCLESSQWWVEMAEGDSVTSKLRTRKRVEN